MKKSKLLIIAFLLGAAYLIYSIMYWTGAANEAITSADTATAVGGGLATMIVMPHLIATAIAVIFNGFGAFMNKRGFVLTGAILYAVAAILFIPYALFVLLQMILSFIGFAMMKKQNTNV